MPRENQKSPPKPKESLEDTQRRQNFFALGQNRQSDGGTSATGGVAVQAPINANPQCDCDCNYNYAGVRKICTIL